MKTIDTVPHVQNVSERGATILLEGREVLIPWGELRRAATQDDADLGAIYAGLLEDAKDMASRCGPLAVKVVRCQSGVGHRVQVVDVAGDDILFSGGFRRADEGGDHHGGGDDGFAFARLEADEITEKLARLGRTVRTCYR